MNANRYWEAGSTGMLKKTTQSSVTVKYSAVDGILVMIVAGLGTTGAFGIT